MPNRKRTRGQGRQNKENSQGPSTTTYFRDGILAVRGYRFRRAVACGDPGSVDLVAEGVKLDGRNETHVVAKIAQGSQPEKEAYIMRLLSGSLEGSSRVLRVIEAITIPPVDGDVKVIICRHPGDNVLSQYMSYAERTRSLLPGSQEERERATHQQEPKETRPDAKMPSAPVATPIERTQEDTTGRSIDLSSFLHFALQAAQCLEVLHATYGAHGDVRPSTFHWSEPDDLVRFAHLGGQSIHLENYGSTASLVLDAQHMPPDDQEAVHDMLCYLPPEYIGNTLGGPNHLSDMYGLGATFWRLLAGRRMFSGTIRAILSSITSREPPSLQFVRADIPAVISKIVQRLLSKNPDERYASASGLKEDLIECNRNLGQGWASEAGTVELIKDFPLGRSDHHSVFHIYGELFGREQEAKLIQRGIREFAAQYKRRPHTLGSQYGSVGSGSVMSTDSFEAAVSSAASTASTNHSLNVLYPTKRDFSGEAGLRMLVVKGSAGSGKSSLLSRECHREIPPSALVGQAKFDPGLCTPYSAILQCLASVFRQLLTFSNAEIFAFGNSLHERLGPQISNIPLLFSAVPEFERLVKTVWTDAFVSDSTNNTLGTTESRVRFENLLTDIITELALHNMVAFFLDDLHNADASSLAMIEAFSRSRVNILILATVRTSNPAAIDRLSSALGARLTIVPLRPLTSHAISGLVCRTLHISPDEATPLVTCLVRHSHGNPFTVRNLLFLLKSENYLVFNFSSNQWTFSPSALQHFLDSRSKINPDNVDANFLLQHLRELQAGTQQVLAISAVIGPVFDARLVFSFMEDMDRASSTDDSDDVSDEPTPVNRRSSNAWVSGLQNAIMEGMIVTRGKDVYAFTHDRYREASLDLAKLYFGGLSHISAKLVDMMMDEEKRDNYRISDQILRGFDVLQEKPWKNNYTGVLVGAGLQALSQGAPEAALTYYQAAYRLMGAEAETSIILKLSELLTWKGDVDQSETLLANVHRLSPDEKVSMLQTRSRNLHSRQQLAAAQELLLDGLRELGTHLKSEYSEEEVDERHRSVREQILEFGLDNIRNLAPVTDGICNLRNILLSEVWIFAYFQDQRIARMIAYEGISLALQNGVSAHNGMAFICFASAAVMQRDFIFATQVGRLALELSNRLSTPVDKGRVHLYFVSLVAPSDSEHFMQTWSLALQGYKLARAGGDALFAAFGQCHLVSNKFYTFQTLSDAIECSELAIEDMASMPKDSSAVSLTLAIQRALKAIAGQTYTRTPDNVLDSDDWDNQAYLASNRADGLARDSILNWHESYRNAALYNLGFYGACVELGRFTSSTAHLHPGHRHNQLSQFYVGLAACHMAREDPANKEYMLMAKGNLADLGVCLEPSRINIAHWYYLLAAEISSFHGEHDAVLLYDKAIDAAERGQWALEHAWALYLVGLHFERLGASNMSASFQKQAFAKFTAIGANGVIKRLVGIDDDMALPVPLTTVIDYCDVEVQTDQMASSVDEDAPRDAAIPSENAVHIGAEDMDVRTSEESLERVIQHLSSKDLAILIYALQAITTDVNLSSSLERLTNLMMSTTSASAQLACIVARHEESGNFHLFTTQRLGETVNILSPTVALEDNSHIPDEGVIVSVIQHVLHSGKPLCLAHVANDPRFKHEAEGLAADISSVLVLPIRSKGIAQGALYLASYRESAFSEGDVLVLNLLAMQAAVLVSNGFLFASLRRSTQANLRAISEQRTALEAARKSQEEALHATRVKSIFLANMGHEMRTPFAAFYGVLGLLSETDLTHEQRELVGTAKQSCELMLETISALLDFSKLEAHAVKLSIAPLSLTDLLVDCQELLITLASEKQLDLTYNVDPDVPIVQGDGARMRQILQNLIGNALKFTLKGSVDAWISVDHTKQVTSEPGVCVVQLKVTDTGIGLSKADIARLFLPFSQVDSSSTRSFGGTGLGLSICRELINLMGGTISVTSQVGVGSCFTCLIPLHICSTIPSSISAAEEEIAALRDTLTSPLKTTVYAFSPSTSTRGLLANCLRGLNVSIFDSIDQLKAGLSSLANTPSDAVVIYPTAVIVDGAQGAVDQLLGVMDDIPPLRRTRVVQLLPRSLNTIHRPGSAQLYPADSTSPRVSRCSKPLRASALLRALGEVQTLPVTDENTLRVPTDTSSPSTTGSTPTPRVASTALPVPAAPTTPKIASNFTPVQLELFKSTRILIAEDNLVAQRLLSRQLQNLGFIVTATSNGLEAVDQWLAKSAGHFTVALFDHHMPQCDGLDAARRIRKLEREKGFELAIPIISLTADAHTQAMEDCLNAGMQMYLTKPLRQDDLIKLIRTFVLAEGPTPHAS